MLSHVLVQFGPAACSKRINSTGEQRRGGGKQLSVEPETHIGQKSKGGQADHFNDINNKQ